MAEEADLDWTNLSKWKVADLKRELTVLGLSVKGKKDELVARLEQHLTQGDDDEDANLGDDVGDVDDGEGGDGDDLDEENGDAEEDVTDSNGAVDEPVAPASQPVAAVQTGPKTVAVSSVAVPSSGQEAVRTKSEDERKAERAERFGVKSADVLKAERAARFGLPPSGDQKKADRAKRFGVAGSDSQGSSSSAGSTSIDKLKSRAERFGGQIVSSKLQKASETEAMKRRAERFGPVDTSEAKKAKRSERFG